ncbi:tripartite tricarboxylate transporter substrate binding protein [Pusillimonas sp. MFBS29]|nr:tripartite tricarboxylate transporter substrate binding protein [Pusillimonas sp. MFBS29]
MLIGSATPLVLSPLTNKVDYTLADFKLIGTFACPPLWLIVKNDAKWKTLEDFVQDAKKNADEISVGTYGSLSAADFLVQSFSKEANIKVINTPFKSTPDALTNVLGGHVDAALVSGGGGLLGGGKLRILAVGQESRLKSYPDVPTFTEAGYPISVEFCYTFAVHKDTPKAVVDRLYQAQKAAMENDPENIERVFQNADMEARLGTPEETMALYKENHALFSRLVDEMRAPGK